MEAMNANTGQAATGAGLGGETSTHLTSRVTRRINVNRIERAASVLLGGTLLGRGLTRPSLARGALMLVGGVLLYRGISGRCYLYQVLGVSTARRNAGRQVERSITIGRSPAELYRFWHEPGNLNRIMGHLGEVTAASKERTHWRVRGPLGRSLEWDAQMVEDRPGEYLRWASVAGAEVPNEGSICFRPAPADWGTEVRLRFRFVPPGGLLGEAALQLLNVVPSMLAGKALRRFKSLAETGEIPTTEHNPSARPGARDE